MGLIVMKNALNVAIFGLNLETLDQMKNQLLLSVPTDVNVQWVNISSNEIDLLLLEYYDLIEIEQENYYSIKTYKTIMKNMKYLIDNLGYKEQITRVKNN